MHQRVTSKFPVSLTCSFLLGLGACAGSRPGGTSDSASTNVSDTGPGSEGTRPWSDPEKFNRDKGLSKDLGAATTDLTPEARDVAPPPLRRDAGEAPIVSPQAYGRCKTACAGATQVFHNAKYDKWVQVVLCTSRRYEILLGDTESGPFYKVGDKAGHGQDHCELVNPSFTLAVEDSISSGNCPSCAVGGAGSVVDIPWLSGKPIYTRGAWGKPFLLEKADKIFIHTSCWYECGVAF